jgi:hypothetical protein
VAPRWPAVLELAERCARGPSFLNRLLAPRTPQASNCPGSNGGVPDLYSMRHFSILLCRIVERNENVLIQAFIAQPRIKALDVCVLDRLARFDELQPYAMLVGPLVGRPAAQLGTVVGLNH